MRSDICFGVLDDGLQLRDVGKDIIVRCTFLDRLQQRTMGSKQVVRLLDSCEDFGVCGCCAFFYGRESGGLGFQRAENRGDLCL